MGMPFSGVKRAVIQPTVPVRTRVLPATFPQGRGVNQPSGRIKVRHAHPPKTRRVARP